MASQDDGRAAPRSEYRMKQKFQPRGRKKEAVKQTVSVIHSLFTASKKLERNRVEACFFLIF